MIVAMLTPIHFKDPQKEAIVVHIIAPELDELEKILDNNYGFRGRKYFERK